MTIIGEAFVALRPDAAGFGKEAEAGITKGLSGLAVGGGIAVAGVALIGTIAKIGASFEDAFATIQRQTGATGLALAGLGGTLRTVFAATPSSLKDVTTALDQVYIRTGATGNALKTLTTQEVDFARITKADVASTVDATTSLLNKMGVATKDQSAALDTLFKGTQVSGKGIDTMASDLARTTPILQALNLSFGQQVALVAGLERGGAKVQSVTTGLAKVFAAAAKSGQDPLKLFATLTDELRTAKTQTEATTIAVQNFGVRAGPELARAVRAGNLDLGALFRQITSGKDGIIATAQQTATLGDRFKQLRNDAMNALEPVGMRLVGWAQKELPHVVNAMQDVQFAAGVAASAWDNGVAGNIVHTNNWTTLISGAGAAVKGLQSGWEGIALPKNAPLIETWAFDVGYAFKNIWVPGLKDVARAIDEVVTGKLPGFQTAMDKLANGPVQKLLEGPVSKLFGNLGAAPNLSVGTAEERLHAFEAAHGRPVGGVNAGQNSELGSVLPQSLDRHLGATSPIVIYLKAIHDELVAQARVVVAGAAPPITTQQAQQKVAAVAGAGMAARVAHLS